MEKVLSLFGIELTEEDKLSLKNFEEKLGKDSDLRKSHLAYNSESNKRDIYDEKFEKALFGYVNDRFYFYKKMEDPKIRKQIINVIISRPHRRTFGVI